jgi:uncharacterized lipoprotein YajG
MRATFDSIIKELKTKAMRKITAILADILITGALAMKCTLNAAQNVVSAETTPVRPTQSVRVNTKSRR